MAALSNSSTIAPYTRTEKAILCDYFQIERPDELKVLNIFAEAPGVYAKKAQYGSKFNIPNAVARIALSRVQDALPAWACYQEGNISVARTYSQPEDRAVELLPLYLITINWADSGPGFSWPEAYYLVWLPEFDRYVVTASQDSTDCYGFEDIAIGFAPYAPDRKQIAKKLITDWWLGQSRSYDQAEWECIFDTGFISEDEAYEWRDEVWSANQCEDEEGDL